MQDRGAGREARRTQPPQAIAANRPDLGGAMFVITLPVPVNALLAEEETMS